MSFIRPLFRVCPKQPLGTSIRGLATSSPRVATPTSINPGNSGLMTHVLPPKVDAALHLKTGQSYYGQGFGSTNSKFGETVFSTSITSCQLDLAFGVFS